MLRNGRYGAAAAAAVLLAGQSLAWGQETIDFEANCNGVPGACAAGTIVNTIESDGGTVVSVSCLNPALGAANAAMIFDSNNPTGGDVDLGTPNSDFGGPGIDADGNAATGGNAGSPFQNNVTLDNILIVSEDLNSANPDDADVVGASCTINFPSDVEVSSIDILDVEADEPAASVQLKDGGGATLNTVTLPQTGDNGHAMVSLGPTSGVRQMIVLLNGSGAIDNIVFTPGDGGEGCTPGFWKNHLEDWGPSGLDPSDDFDTTFGVDLFDPDIALGEAVNARGGGVNKLARHGTAALINALHPGVDYPLSAVQVIAAVQAGDADTLIGFNELGCDID